VLATWIALFTGTYFQYQTPPLSNGIIDEFGLTSTQFSRVFSAPMIPAIFLSIFAGVLADKYGVKKVVITGFIFTNIGLLLRVFAVEYNVLFVSMIISGIGTAILNANIVKILVSVISPDKISNLVGFIMTASTLAMVIATSTTMLFGTIQSAFIVASLLSFVALLLLLFLPKSTSTSNSIEAEFMSGIKHVLVNKKIIVLGLLLMLILGIMISLSGSLPLMFSELYGVSPSTIGLYSTLFMVGNLVGSVTSSYLSRGMNIYQYTTLVSVVAIVFVLVSYFMMILWLFVITTFIVGVILGSLLPKIASSPVKIPEIGPELAGTAGGVISTMQLIGAVVIPSYIIAPIILTNYSYYLVTTAILFFGLLLTVVLFKKDLLII